MSVAVERARAFIATNPEGAAEVFAAAFEMAGQVAYLIRGAPDSQKLTETFKAYVSKCAETGYMPPGLAAELKAGRPL